MNLEIFSQCEQNSAHNVEDKSKWRRLGILIIHILQFFPSAEAAELGIEHYSNRYQTLQIIFDVILIVQEITFFIVTVHCKYGVAKCG